MTAVHLHISFFLYLTCERCVSPSLQIHFTVTPLAHFCGIVTNFVAAVFATAQADSLLEAVGPSALKGIAQVLLVHQRVHKQVHSTLVFTLHHLHEI